MQNFLAAVSIPSNLRVFTILEIPRIVIGQIGHSMRSPNSTNRIESFVDRIWLFDFPKKLHAAILVHLFVYFKALIRLFVTFAIFSRLLLLEFNICRL